MAKMHPEAVELFYEESKAAREALDATLKEYRSNTTTALALATGAAAFFGFEDSGKGIFFVLALVAYGIAALLAVAVFWPHGWLMNPASDFAQRLTDADKLRYR